ncbi:hypothetical protein MKQ68_11750 [Chitinophaga horti]|uniref:DUF1579 domain-containing protein n=1 Tax=Chitinophaga horti TaxID=2920382 RepID=A0ABY6J8W8_9BACT|nr:hypothetical protein [Chitinophaga horti]UYQ95776.1 hypothetical protein MKQ68_11750 [Chitinophaga horti]
MLIHAKKCAALALLAIVLLSAFQPQAAPAAESPTVHYFPSAKKELLGKIIGRWITQTTVLPKDGQPRFKTLGSDVYQWSPDGNFVVHTAYGIRDKSGFGAIEIIGYNTETGAFNSYNFNPDGSFNIDPLTIENDVWVWTGKKVRSTGRFSNDSNTFSVKHDITADGKTYEPFMDGTLSKGAAF